MIQRMGRVIGINPKDIERYKELHADPWPDTVEQLKQRNIQNFSIFLREPENLLFSYWEYTGNDFQTDFNVNRNDERSKEWLNLVSPLQRPFDSRQKDEWWASMDQIFFMK